MDLDQALVRLVHDVDAPLDLAELALRLARDEYADLDIDAYLSELAGMAHEARKYLRGTLEKRVDGLCRYLCHEMGFHGNTEEYYDPRNSYLNEVLDRRTGIPISLAIVAMSVGQRAGIEVVGVGLPGHFVAKAVADGEEVLFDPFHGGRQLTATDCENLVYQVTGMPFQATPDNLRALPLRPLVMRMLTNLKGVYVRQGDFQRAVRVIERLRQLSPHDLTERRDLGVSLLHAGRPGRAIEHLSAYLSGATSGADADAVRQLLRQAYQDIGRWN
jgi:regulator of sirC expression with transglutaminase-like and TPR domain